MPRQPSNYLNLMCQSLSYFKEKHTRFVLTSSGIVRLIGPAASAFHKELERCISIAKLRLNILSEHRPVETIRAERPTNVERSAVTQQPAKELHPHKILSTTTRVKKNNNNNINNGSGDWPTHTVITEDARGPITMFLFQCLSTRWPFNSGMRSPSKT